MKRFVHILLIACLLAAPMTATAQRVWEEMEATSTITDTPQDQPEITVRGGYVYVTTAKPVTVKIFSILGQLISQKTIPAGTSRTLITARGIYILKAGTVTRRITI